MSNFVPYAHYKTIDGEEVRDYTKENFEKVLAAVNYRIAEKSDRILYFIVDNAKVNGIKFYKDDYIEVLK